MNIRGSCFPEMIPKLMAYIGTIIKANREYAGPKWLRYDMLFWKHEVLRNNTRWSVINPTIYARCFTAATRNPPRCETCLSVIHETKDCTQHDVSKWDIEARLREIWSRRFTTCLQLQRGTMYSSLLKYVGNGTRKKCNYPFCRHTHVCSLCNEGTHPTIRCPGCSRSVMESQPPLWGTRRSVGRS